KLHKRHINTSATFRQWAIIDMDDKHVRSALRISPHYYNTEQELDALIDALQG
ncbi:MAG: aminotransferase, partial [Acidobacteria bacterium]